MNAVLYIEDSYVTSWNQFCDILPSELSPGTTIYDELLTSFLDGMLENWLEEEDGKCKEIANEVKQIEKDQSNSKIIKQLIEDYIDENDSRLREQLAFISEAQKELLYAVHAEREAQNITSMAFNKKYRLRSPSSTQSAALKLLEHDLITRNENVYSISDPLMSLWLDRKTV